MTIEDQFSQFVAHQVELAAKIPPIDWEDRKIEWLSHLAGLYWDIECYLQPHVADGGIVLVREEIHMQEDKIGDYDAPMLVVRIGPTEVFLTPMGTKLIGSIGRVDISGNRGTARLLLRDRSRDGADSPETECEPYWSFTKESPWRGFVPFDKHSLREMLMGIAG